MLYLMIPSDLEAGARGLFWPEPEPDPARTDLIGWEADMDAWSGDDIVGAVDPWFLATARLCEAIRAAELTGLRIGIVANVTYTATGKVLASLGELAEKELPDFYIVVPERQVDVRSVDGDDDGIGRDDDLRYDRWLGDDFSYSRWGPVVSDRALKVLQAYRVDDCQFWRLAPN